MLITVRSWGLPEGHFSFAIIARPGMSLYAFVILWGSSALLIRMATPAFVCGRSGSGKYISSKEFPKHWRIVSARSSSRWVSWTANIAILFVLNVLFINDHLSI